MATIKEQFQSRSRTMVGAFGLANVSRLFRVTVDTYDDEPEVTIQDGRAGGIPIGTPHPKFPGLVSIAYERLTRVSTLSHWVLVWYGDPLTFPTENNYWDYDLDGDFEFEESFFDLDGVPIGHPAFEEWPVNLSAPVNSPNARLFVTKTKKGEVGLMLPDAEDKDLQYHVRPVQIPSETGTIVFNRLAPNPLFPAVRGFGARGAVNSSQFRVRCPEGMVNFGPAGHFLLERISQRARPGTMLGQRNPNRIYDLTVVFRYRRRKWTPHDLRVMYVDPATGAESPVKWRNGEFAGQELTARYRVMREADHSSIMDGLLRPGQDDIVLPQPLPTPVVIGGGR